MNAAPCPSFWPHINLIAISPDGTTLLVGTNGGFARSTDGGATWTQRGVSATEDIDFRPGDSSQVLIGQLGPSFYAVKTMAIFRSGLPLFGPKAEPK